MSGVAVAVLGLVAATLAVAAFGPDLLRVVRRARKARDARDRRRSHAAAELPDPGAVLRAERRAEELLRSVVGEDSFRAYEALGVLYCPRPGSAVSGRPSYGYLIYPHKPIVSFDERTGELLNEHCVAFPDRTLPEQLQRLPAADDVLAKWLSLQADEHRLIDAANMHLPGRQLDPERVRRDLARLGEWTGRASPAGPLAQGRRAA